MSALAARRAALAAKQAEEAENPPAVVAKAVQQPVPPRAASPTPSISESDTSVEIETSAPKRRKTGNAVPKAEDKPRYFVASVDEDEPLPRRKRRAFSPSAPQEDVVSGSSSYGSDSDDDLGVTDGAATPWSGAPSPRLDPGPSRTAGHGLRPCSSSFVAQEGVNFVKVERDALENACIASFGPGVVNLAITGTFLLTPLQRPLSLLSCVVTPSGTPQSFPVYAPTSHPVPVLEAVEDSTSSASPVLTKLKLPRSFIADSSRTVFLLQENDSGVQGLRGDVVPGFNNIWSSDKGMWGLQGVHPVLGSYSTPTYAHTTPRSWHSALDSLRPPTTVPDDLNSPHPEDKVPVVVVKGPKRSGKSALARASLNTLLQEFQQVAWLETDLGQAEFGCGGVVGLWLLDKPVFGPPFTHPRVPLRAQYIGELSPQSCPDQYMAAVHQLISHYQYELQFPLASYDASETRRTDAIPLVVNTQGWTKGLGEELMQAIEAAVEPTHVFGFEQPDLGSPVQATVPLPATSRALHFTVQPAPSSPLQARYTAADMRNLSTIAYLHSRGHKWDFSAPLLAMQPLVVELGSTIKAAYLLGEGADAILPQDLPLALNGSLVALLAAEAEEEVYVPGRSPPSADDATFLGLALVRAVRVEDEGKLTLQLITPLPGAELSRVNALVRNGAMELPTCGLLDWRSSVPGGGVAEEGLAGVRWDEVPFFDAAGSDAMGGGRRRFRKNLQRKNQG